MSWKLLAVAAASIVVTWLAATGLRQRSSPVAATIKRPDRVLLVTIDALRRDYLGLYGYTEKPTSPALDAWAHEAVVFDRAVAPAPWTIASLGALFTGRYPVEIGAYTNSCGISPDFATLPELFRKAGYRTASFNTHRLLINETGGFRRGFDEVEPQSIHPILKGEHKMPYATVEPMLLDWLKKHGHERFFVWVHDMDTHQPTTTGNPYIGRDDWLRYEAEVRWVDEAFSHMMLQLQSLGLWDQTMVVFTADHGEALDEHGILGHQDCMYEEVLRIPLLMQIPGVEGHRRISEPIDHLDLFSTLVDVAGLELPSGSRGESLLPLIQGTQRHRKRPYLFESRYHFEDGHHEIVARDRRWKVLATVTDPNAKKSDDERRAPAWDVRAPDTRLELYHQMLDPGDVTDLFESYPRVIRRMQNAIADWQKTVRPPERLAPELDAASKEALRGLGYGDH